MKTYAIRYTTVLGETYLSPVRTYTRAEAQSRVRTNVTDSVRPMWDSGRRASLSDIRVVEVDAAGAQVKTYTVKYTTKDDESYLSSVRDMTISEANVAVEMTSKAITELGLRSDVAEIEAVETDSNGAEIDPDEVAA